MSKWRRYEIRRPRRFNDGQPVLDALISETLRRLEQRFSAVSWETQSIQGAWLDEGVRYRDELFRVFVDVADRPEHRRFFRQFKEGLKPKFRQMDIWVTTYSIEAL